VAAHDQAIFLPWHVELSVRLEPLAPAVLVCLPTWLVTPRHYTLEPRNGRERASRAVVVLGLLPAAVAVSAAVSAAVSFDSGLLCLRNSLCFIGMLMLFAACSDGRVAGLLITLVVWFTGWLGSDLGPLRDYAWLNFTPRDPTSWAICVVTFVVGCAVDVCRHN
jgi:hypothetical protein